MNVDLQFPGVMEPKPMVSCKLDTNKLAKMVHSQHQKATCTPNRRDERRPESVIWAPDAWRLVSQRGISSFDAGGRRDIVLLHGEPVESKGGVLSPRSDITILRDRPWHVRSATKSSSLRNRPVRQEAKERYGSRRNTLVVYLRRESLFIRNSRAFESGLRLLNVLV